MAEYADKHIDSFRRGRAYPSNGSRTIDDPTFLGFTLLFDFAGSKLFQDHDSVSDRGELIGPLQSQDSAFGYLFANGERERMAMLKAFIDQLIYLNTYKPYFWQSIEGLDTIWSDYNDFEKSPVDKYEFTIKTLETIDLKIFGMMELYRKVCYDHTFRRMILPSNLQKFNVTIYINEIRKIRPSNVKLGTSKLTATQNVYGKIDLDAATGLSDVYGNFNPENIIARIKGNSNNTPSTQNQDDANVIFNWLNSDENGIIMQMSGCTFSPDNGGDMFSNISNNSMEAVTNSMKIFSKKVNISSVLAWYSEKINDDIAPRSNRDSDFWESVSNRANNLLESAARDYYRKASNQIQTKASSLIKQNLPGGLIGSVQDLQRGNLIGALYRLTGRDLGNVYGGFSPTLSQSSNDLGEIYPSQSASETNISPSNLGEIYNDREVQLNRLRDQNNNLGRIS